MLLGLVLTWKMAEPFAMGKFSKFLYLKQLWNHRLREKGKGICGDCLVQALTQSMIK